MLACLFGGLAVVLSLGLGAHSLNWREVFTEPESLSSLTFWRLRLPRTVLAAAVGSILALVGVLLQTSLRNPLADPYLLGVSSAASLGAVLALAAGLGGWRFSSAGFFALICLLVLDNAVRRQGNFSEHHLLLAGVATTYLLGAMTALVVLMVEPSKSRGIMFWLVGGFSNASSSEAALCGLAAVFAAFWVARHSHHLDILALGEESSHVLGLRAPLERRRIFILSGFLVGLSVASAGGIAFLGIMVPHLARSICGIDHRYLVPLSLTLGSGLALSADLLARLLFSPQEIPVGILTAFLGAPFFLKQLRDYGRT